MKTLILTGYDRHMAELAEICLPSKQAWAAEHGVKLRVLRDNYPTDYPREHGHPSFQKLRHIRHALFSEGFDCVFWLDADSIVTSPVFRVEYIHRIRSMRHLIVSKDYPTDDDRPWWNRWSAGHMIWFRSDKSLALLDEAMSQSQFAWSGLWDQDALQSCIRSADDRRRPLILGARFMNSVVPGLTGNPDRDWQPGDFLCHFTGIPHDQRVKVARQFIADNQLHL